ncbi:cobalamin biosynthesis protein [Mesorhizobium sp. RMAD-H1]|uniref:cobalamin biosynthesis protein n=1 Tax=Mesorhizobium sp. RMAD-H1 TaxID=2587065 RepID=UPI001620EBA8|nr:cobalamin biosynthesis protein [Mesorhizobium sp. RMAD-H1]MBB2970986.1 cobalamin biosynthesis protein CbiG [Mesorhizobium sp. RMAD-H1]
MAGEEQDRASEQKRPFLALGVGCERGAAAAEAIGLAERALQVSGFAVDALGGIFSLDRKKAEPAVRALGEHFRREVVFFDAQRLEEETPRLLNPSEAVYQAVGCHGVAESAALAGAGPFARLIVPKMRSQHVTVAIAMAE